MKLKSLILALAILLLLPTLACDWSDCPYISEAMDQDTAYLDYLYALKDAGVPVNQDDIDTAVAYAGELQQSWQESCQGREGG